MGGGACVLLSFLFFRFSLRLRLRLRPKLRQHRRQQRRKLPKLALRLNRKKRKERRTQAPPPPDHRGKESLPSSSNPQKAWLLGAVAKGRKDANLLPAPRRNLAPRRSPRPRNARKLRRRSKHQKTASRTVPRWRHCGLKALHRSLAKSGGLRKWSSTRGRRRVCSYTTSSTWMKMAKAVAGMTQSPGQ